MVIVFMKMHEGADGIVFFFQAEDGIRDYKVTGVQTCALPIYHPVDAAKLAEPAGEDGKFREVGEIAEKAEHVGREEIGRASCRGRVEISVGAVSLKKKKRTKTTEAEICK